MKQKIKIPELLAPAGSFELAITAFEQGADAVYTGLKEHNARVGCDNLSYMEFAALIEYARKKGKKVYLTLNTLVKEDELRGLFQTLGFIKRVRPHAVIVQDSGLIAMIRENVPGIEIHTSTQMGAHNSYSLKTFKNMGASRVILERQVTVEEINLMAENDIVEIETFIHGALCCSLSGKCLFSSWMGGHSGNRGRCKQPCRRRFHGSGGNGFFFSTRDLCGLDNILELAAAGISSFKIEGRLRGRDYVTKTVKAYRMLMDSPAFRKMLKMKMDELNPDHQSISEYKKALKASGAVLGSLPARTWSGLFKEPKDFKSMVQYKAIGVQGRYIGKVVSNAKGNVSVALTHPLALGDRVRVQSSSGDEGPAILIKTLLTKYKNKVERLRRGETGIIIGPPEIQKGDMVFLTGRQSFMDPSKSFSKNIFKTMQISRVFPDDEFDALKITQSFDLNVYFSTDRISVSPRDASDKFVWTKELSLEEANDGNPRTEILEGEFKKLDLPGFAVDSIQVSCPIAPFISQRELRRIRKEYQDWFLSEETGLKSWLQDSASQIVNFFKEKNGVSIKVKNDDIQGFEDFYKKGPFTILKESAHYFKNALIHEKENFNTLIVDPRQIAFKTSSKRSKSRSERIDNIKMVKATDIDAFESWVQSRKGSAPAEEALLPSFCPETGVNSVLRLVTQVLKRGLRRFQVSDWFNFSLLMEGCKLAEVSYEELVITTSYPLPAANSLAVDQILGLGASVVTLWPELEKKALEKTVAKRPDFTRICVKSRLPLLMTRAEINSSGKVSDSRGKRFILRRNRGLTTVYSEKVFSIPSIGDAPILVDFRSLSEKNDTSEFNYSKELV